MGDYVTVKQAAEALRCSGSAVRRYLQEGLLRGEKPGRDWLVEVESLVTFESPKTGRPRRWASDEEAAQNRASVAVYDAVKRGELVPQPCEVCGDPRTEAHHDDYEKPLEVRWLCRRHHRYLTLGRL